MAGIGFVLKKLVSKDDLLGIFRAYTHSALASTGPWLFTVIALGGVAMLYSGSVPTGSIVNFRDQLLNFRVIIIYNFAFSLVLSAPVFMVITRYLADCIHRKDVTNTPSILLGSLFLLYAIQAPIAIWFYGYYTDLSLSLRIAAMVNLFLITSIWLFGVFLTALKDYNAVTWNYGIGMVIAVAASEYFRGQYHEVGMINGFSMGLAYVVFSLAAKVFAEYPYKMQDPFATKPYFKKYWELALGGIFYNAAIWVDKWIMWFFAPEAIHLPSKMAMYPDYDSAMFLAYLTIVPSMAAFVFSVETNFFERYQRFYDDVLNHATLSKIRENHKAILESIFGSARNFLVIQGSICLLAILLAAKIFDVLGVNFLQIGIFRLGTLAAFFHVLVLFEMIILSYFDSRRITMYLQLFFLLSNCIFTFITLKMGFPFYGYGYFISAVLTFLITSMVLFTHVKHLPYHAFLTSNNSIRNRTAKV